MKIIFPNNGGGIAMLMPCECGLTVEQIAQKDVPFGVPFLILPDSAIPDSPQEAWEADFSKPDGIGMGAQRYFIAKAESEIAAIGARVPPEPVVAGEDGDPERVAIFNAANLAAFHATNARQIAERNELIAQMRAELEAMA